MAQYMLNNKYKFLKEKSDNQNIIRIDIDNTIISNKFNISSEKKYETNDTIDDSSKEEKNAKKKSTRKKIARKKINKKIIESNIDNTSLKKQLIKKEVSAKKKSDLVKRKPVIRKAKKVKNIESISNNNTQKAEDSKQVKTGWWDI